MRHIAFRGLRAGYRTWGQGVPVLFLHSGGSSGMQWDKMAGALSSACTMIAPDLLGFGNTEPWTETGGLTHDLQAELAATVIEASVERPVDVVGHSYGGATAIRLALDHPHRVRSLVLIEPVMSCLLRDAGDPLFPQSVLVAMAFIDSVDKGQPELGWEAFIDSRNGTGTWSRLSRERQRGFIGQSRQTREAFMSNLNNRTTLAECRLIRVPTTLVCGADTTAPDRRISEVVRDAIEGAGYVVIPDAGHMSPLTHPHRVAHIVCEHLEHRRA